MPSYLQPGGLLLRRAGSAVEAHRFTCPTACGGLSSPTRDWTCILCVGRWIVFYFLKIFIYLAPLSPSCDMRDLGPGSGIKPGPLHWELGVLATKPAGNLGRWILNHWTAREVPRNLFKIDFNTSIQRHFLLSYLLMFVLLILPCNCPFCSLIYTDQQTSLLKTFPPSTPLS